MNIPDLLSMFASAPPLSRLLILAYFGVCVWAIFSLTVRKKPQQRVFWLLILAYLNSPIQLGLPASLLHDFTGEQRFSLYTGTWLMILSLVIVPPDTRRHNRARLLFVLLLLWLVGTMFVTISWGWATGAFGRSYVLIGVIAAALLSHRILREATTGDILSALETFVWCYLGAAWLFTMLYVAQHGLTSARLVPLERSANYAGLYLSVFLPVIAWHYPIGRAPVRYYFLLIIGTLSIAATGSRAALIGLMLAMLSLIATRDIGVLWRHSLKTILALCAIGLLFVTVSQRTSLSNEATPIATTGAIQRSRTMGLDLRSDTRMTYIWPVYLSLIAADSSPRSGLLSDEDVPIDQHPHSMFINAYYASGTLVGSILALFALALLASCLRANDQLQVYQVSRWARLAVVTLFLAHLAKTSLIRFPGSMLFLIVCLLLVAHLISPTRDHTDNELAP